MNEQHPPPLIVHVITRLIVGGAQENTLYTVEGLARRPDRWRVILITGPSPGPEGDLLDRARRGAFPTILVRELQREVDPVMDAAAFARLLGLFRALRPALVHTHSSKAGILGRWAARAARVPRVVHTIHGLPFHRRQPRLVHAAYAAAERWTAPLTDRIVVVADAMRDQALAAGVGRPDQYRTVRSGLELEPFLGASAHRTAARARWGLQAEDRVVGNVGRLAPLKGHDDLLEAFAAARKAHPRARLLLIGDGTLRSALTRRVSDLGLAGAVVFAGLLPTPQIPSALSAMDLVVHTSYREGLARVLPQALLAGVPVIAYDIDGAREVVRHGETGLLVPCGDRAGLGAALTEGLGGLGRLREMALRGRARCREEFSVARMVGDLEGLYESLSA